MKKILPVFVLLASLQSCTDEGEATVSPSNLQYSPNEIILKTGRAYQSSIPSVQGTSPFEFSIERIIGPSENEESFISIDESTGVVSIKENNELELGVYLIDVQVSDLNGATSFAGALKFNLIALELPSGLVYSPNEIYVEVETTATSSIPVVNEGLSVSYSIPSNESFITIDTQTGEVTFDASFAPLGEYPVDVLVENEDGTTLFENALTFIVGEHLIEVEDGYYLGLEGLDPSSSQLLDPYDGVFDQREGLYYNFIYLESGDYFVSKISFKKLELSFGLGSTESLNNEESTCASGDFLVVNLTSGGSAIHVSQIGLYEVALDLTSNKLVLMKVETVGITGSATEVGWNTSLQLTAIEEPSHEGALWKLENILLKVDGLNKDYKLKINCLWSLKVPTNSNDYFYLPTNFGGQLENLVLGGEDLSISESGYFTITVNWDSDSDFSLSLLKTGDYTPPAFDPNSYQWGIIGSATTTGWDSDTNLTYLGKTNDTYVWQGSFPLTNGIGGGDQSFRFRTNDTWDFHVLAYSNIIAFSGTTSLIAADTADNFIVTEDGTYSIKLSTNDEGLSWSLEIHKE